MTTLFLLVVVMPQHQEPMVLTCRTLHFIGDDVPDAKTIWAFRERLKELDLTEKLFARFDEHLNNSGFNAKRGQIVDASIVRAPIRRDSREINEKLKQGEEIAEWNDNTRAQKDTDAKWTQKNGKQSFGYKNHIAPDVEHKLIRGFAVTPANVHDSNECESILSPNADPSVYADSAYMSAERMERIKIGLRLYQSIAAVK